jgi:type III restriction enzyme
MNTVGKPGKLGEQVRCVVSVSMLTEGWDTNSVTHILGVRAFGTQLLCEQVVGRGLRRVSYDPDAENRFAPEYANVFGIPFSFAQESAGVITTVPPKPARRVYALPERAKLEIRFPRLVGYRVKLPSDRLRWMWDRDSRFVLSPAEMPTRARIADLIGGGETITLENYMDQRLPTAAFHVAGHALRTRFRDEQGNLKPYLFPQLLAATKEWLASQLACTGGTRPGLFLWKGLADEAVLRIYNACVRGGLNHSIDEETGGTGARAILLPVIDPYNPSGSSRFVDMRTSKDMLWTTAADRCHINLVVADSEWELAFCETLETALSGMVLSYVKNHGLHFEVPYAVAGGERRYRPDFILTVDEGRGASDPLHLIVEIKGFRGIDAQNKREAVDTHWIPAVNNHGGFGQWAFIEIGDAVRAEEMIRGFLMQRAERAAA